VPGTPTYVNNGSPMVGDAGLLHVGARYYDPQVGRFTSSDAVLSEHPYLYCEHEPDAGDPSGMVYIDINIAFTIPVPIGNIPVPFTFGGGFQYGNTRPGGKLGWHPYFNVGLGWPPRLSWSLHSLWDYITPGAFVGYGMYILPASETEGARAEGV